MKGLNGNIKIKFNMKYRTKFKLKARKRRTCEANQKSIMAATVDVDYTLARILALLQKIKLQRDCGVTVGQNQVNFGVEFNDLRKRRHRAKLARKPALLIANRCKQILICTSLSICS